MTTVNNGNVEVIGRLRRHYMASNSPAVARRVSELEAILDNQISHYKAISNRNALDKHGIEAIHKLVLITKELEQASSREHEKMEKALENMTPEELALAEKQALELLGIQLPGPGDEASKGGLEPADDRTTKGLPGPVLTHEEFRKAHKQVVHPRPKVNKDKKEIITPFPPVGPKA